jgi:hypothetical protein
MLSWKAFLICALILCVQQGEGRRANRRESLQITNSDDVPVAFPVVVHVMVMGLAGDGELEARIDHTVRNLVLRHCHCIYILIVVLAYSASSS